MQHRVGWIFGIDTYLCVKRESSSHKQKIPAHRLEENSRLGYLFI
jgi:hypothetical protein